MKIALEEWGKKWYSPPPSLRILRAWANSGQIDPAPEKVGRRWMVDQNAVRISHAAIQYGNANLSARARKILNT